MSSLVFLPLRVLFIQEVPQVGVDFIREGTQLPAEELPIIKVCHMVNNIYPHYMWTNTCTTLYLRVGVSTQSISLCWSCSQVSMLPLELQNEKIKTLLTTGSRGAKTKNVHYCYNCFTFRAGYIDTIKYTCNVYYSFRTGRIRNCRDKHGCCSSLPHFRQ